MPRNGFLPFSLPDIGQGEINEVVKVLSSGWITSGQKVAAFEKAFAEYVGSPYALTLTSCTAGLHLAMEILDLQPGDEVITTSLTWPATVNMIHLCGGRPVFVDVERDTFNLDVSQVEEAITDRTRAILPVHFAGQSCELEKLRKICKDHSIELIEDAAHAVGSEYKGARIGSGNNMAVFSFHPIKNMTTGEGGMITTHNSEIFERLRTLRFHGVDKDAWKRYGRGEKAGYELYHPGWKYNMTDIQAAIGLVQLERLDGMIEKRMTLAALYDDLLSEVHEITRPGRVPYDIRHAWHLYTIQVDRDKTGIPRDEFMEEMGKRNIGTGLHFRAVHELSFYKNHYPLPVGSLPETEFISESIVSLPLYPGMNESDVYNVVAAIRDIVKKFKE
ncbi:MAG: DegT/DnrJ/EryC1/StrS aminotransferase family protein [Candidatus Scalindua sp. AMX11]|nr:MAG: DegT/DnrJ/EryC1/StrS aminotransferase family protein [Candidatus Scalindua sp.]NOG82609.1 DegT/DnrJ/EryC1/StrS aminotransferase family protein [Planctomycetota bacterium]RZV78316.1 MAG: DegT/DnrJ/EryC1/StrS aminotransferase family protein [Candidatus Scalindua sp. SCAELEC01]TDE65135.1 MAG: DegT/DnrJ/EryC1/StrS aminotransferase family protein [Candidatus Scalindua sp. AMX11]GJQ59515.1 MAG: spore coat protein [Candidatus Scalindua sp.]